MRSARARTLLIGALAGGVLFGATCSRRPTGSACRGGEGDGPRTVCRDVLPYEVSCALASEERLGEPVSGFRDPQSHAADPSASLEVRSILAVDSNEAVAVSFDGSACGVWKGWVVAWRSGLSQGRVDDIPRIAETAP